jgi:hypothetical protein
MAKTAVSFGRVHLVGSIIVAAFFATLPAVLVYKATGTEVGAFLLFVPAAILLTRLLLWTQERALKRNADDIRLRYKSGRVPVGTDRR